MTNISEIKNDNIQYDLFNWEHNHGVGFLSQLLFELGYPAEPEETLLDVLKEVHKKSGAYIISLEDARAINGQYDEVAVIDDKHRHIAIDSRIEAREERLRLEKKERDEFPF